MAFWCGTPPPVLNFFRATKMFFQKSKTPPYFWLRAAISVIFFVGAVGLFFWAEGFRVSGGKIIETGVFSASVFDGFAALTVDGKLTDKTPTIVLGERVGAHRACLFQNNKTPFCQNFFLTADRAEIWEKVVLLPAKFHFQKIAKKDEILFDPFGRGFFRFFPAFSAAAVFDGEKWKMISEISGDELLANRDGRLFFGNSATKYFFKKSKNSKIAPKKRGFLFFQKNKLFFRDLKKNETTRIAAFSAPILDAFFAPDSDSIFVFLPTEIDFFSRFDAPPQKLFDGKNFRFFPKSRQILFLKNDFWYFWKI